jgi:hypothetical protein
MSDIDPFRRPTGDVLAINYYIESDGAKKYECRGFGYKYEKFFNVWVPSSSYRFVHMDFPWVIFVFDNPEDHERLIRDYPDDVSFYEYVDDDDE